MDANQLNRDLSFQATLRNRDYQFRSTWGLFSPRAIDEGSRLLIDQLDIPTDASVLDLGCGYGPLGLVCATIAPNGHVDMVDKDFVAIEYARQNAKINGIANTTAYLSNGFSQVPADKHFDVVISNVPAKIGSELLTIFLTDAYSRLNHKGQLYVVTISGLKEYMKRNLTNVFGNYEKLKQSKTYTAARAIKK